MKIGMLFHGYGGQFVGMGKELYDGSRTMQEYFEEASNCLNTNFVKLCFASSDSELEEARNAYPAIFLMGVSLYALLKEAGVEPSLVAGHDIGEYAALYAAGSITFPDGLYFLNKYATALQEQLDALAYGALSLMGVSTPEVKKLCARCSTGSQCVSIVSYQSDDTVVIAGTRDAVMCVKDMCGDEVVVKDRGFGYGLHSSLMDKVSEAIKIYIEKIDVKDLKVLLINNVDGVLVKGGESAKYSLLRQMNEPLLWNQVMENFADADLIITVGPGTELATIAQKMYPNKQVISVNKKSDIEQVKQIVQGDLRGND